MPLTSNVDVYIDAEVSMIIPRWSDGRRWGEAEYACESSVSRAAADLRGSCGVYQEAGVSNNCADGGRF